MTRPADPLRVALSMLTLVPGGMGGSETYARALTEQLHTTDKVRTTAFVPSTAAGFSRGIPEVVVSSVRVGPSTRGRLAGVASATLNGRSIRAAMANADAVHYPFTVMVPRPAKWQAVVQSLLDVQHLELPHMFGRAELLYRRHFYEGAAKTADIVVTISEFAKRRMVELLGIAPDRIHVAHLGVDMDRYTPNLGPRENFVLYPARGWAHKNHARLIQAMAILRRDRPELRLVLTGGALDALGDLPDWVDRRGLVSSDELLSLYRSAAALAFPSLYEGFGLPPLEAMASGCPAAVSNAGSIPEVCGDAAVLFDPMHPEDIAAGIARAIDDGERLSAGGMAQAARFTWESCGDAHVTAYGSAIERHGG
ncbi:glycosyltransferase involved in cell wall biosynthesis [Marisediminicola sp. UYEF4]|uniref:glycosyltransferase family 4 protein n=1 Tax=Marisediminicola sp. UYEF4 TaxID=1756384 RepID=UPI0033910DC7